MLLTLGTVNAQNNFRGIVKYKIESTGQVAMQIPAEQSTVEVKVYDDQIMLGNSIQRGMTITQCIDMSMALAYLAANDIELESYQGDGKFLVKDKATKESLDSLALEDKEPGHFYFEYANETRDILGYTAKKLIMHSYDEEGVDHPAECWYTDQIGPEYNILFNGIKGMPLVLAQNQGEGKQITYTATEIVKGKVKEVDLLLPAGYKEASKEELQTFMKEFQEAIELLQD